MAEDAALVYGLELSSRCLCSQVGETNRTRFLVASQSLRQENQVHLLEYDDENNRLSKYLYRHPVGAVWHISASYNDPALLATCHDSYDPEQGRLVKGCTVWRLPTPLRDADDDEDRTSIDAVDPATGISLYEPGSSQNDSGSGGGGLSVQFRLNCDDDPISHALWKPVERESGDASVMTFGATTLRLYDGEREAARFALPEPKRPLSAGKWSPHHGSKQFAVATGERVIGWDVRSDCEAFVIESAHAAACRELDFNPNKQYYMATCGDDSLVKFWDVRAAEKPLSVCGGGEGEHSHWVWSARYNPFHDQLVLSCGSDCKVALHDKSSVSSEPYGNYVDDDDSDDDNNEDDDEEQKVKEERKPVEDHLIAVYDEHEESVYAVEWSAAEPWSFASVSYDGRVVVNKVPKKVKFDILL